LASRRNGFLYWWGRGKNGWTESEGVSSNTLSYSGYTGIAHISYRSMDAMAVIRLASVDSLFVDTSVIKNIRRLVGKGYLLPFVNQELARLGEVQKIESNNACFLPVKDPIAGNWCFHERFRVNGGLLSTVSSADGQPYTKVMKANNWSSDTLSSKGILLERQLLNKHFELTFIDSFGNMYVTTNHSLVNDSDDYLLDVFKYSFNPKVGDYTLKSLHFDKWNSNLAGFVMNQNQTKGLFYSDLAGGFGKSDIYMCDIVWSNDRTPTLSNYFNLGDQINTLLSDIDPVFITDEIISFSTEGHIGWGGSDVWPGSQVCSKEGACTAIIIVCHLEYAHPPLSALVMRSYMFYDLHVIYFLEYHMCCLS
jgi:hypothetical protein